MGKAASQNPEVHILFSSLSGISTFFSQSPQRLSVLDCVSKRIPRGSITRWNFNSRVINTVYENINDLKICFKELQESKNIPTDQAASGLLHMLNDKHFLFWLSFFHHIMPHVDLLYDQLQRRNAHSFNSIQY
jgi:protein-tyrosine phosphatase